MNMPLTRKLKRIARGFVNKLTDKPKGPTIADFFDTDWYRTQAPKLDTVEDALAHYLANGVAQNLNPHPLFNTNWYLRQYPDVANAGLNPLLHYVESGAKEGRSPSAYFDATWYTSKYPAANFTQGGALAHFLQTGARTNCNPNPYFDTEWYQARYPEVQSYARDPLSHFVLVGERAGYQPGPSFDPSWYVMCNPDVAQWSGTAFEHYLTTGARENRTAVRGPYDFQSAVALAKGLAAPIVSTDCIRATLELPVGSIRDMIDKPDGAELVYLAPERSAEGITEKLAPYPGLPYVALLHDALALGGTRYLVAGEKIRHDEAAAFQNVKDAALKYHRAAQTSGGNLMLNFQLKPANWVDTGIDVMHEYSNNYFHFVAETLPRMILAEEAELPADVPYIVERDLHENMAKLLSMANTSGRPILPVESDTMYRVGALYIPSDVTSVVDSYEAGESGRWSCLDVPRIRTAVARCKAFVPSTRAVLRKRKIYAGRSGGIRQLTNQQELEAALAARGFEIMRTDGLDVQTQITIFREAEVIIAPTGAQLTNLVWVEPGTQVIVLASDHPSHQLYLWELLGRVSKADVTCVIGPRAYVRNDKYSVHDDYSINVQHVLDLI
ncbi:glycosyltransferase family 61 protein [Achromobacter sp. B7]|uniref:glycosyltransferase family 61 protein n=1 Tax=Achromobacter sp. B7 TaxID=2282475 RepID=UPI000E77128F|nr:glycosyltransferase 61 family protein [Achromobacter sp. B7]AYD67196.1 glycosyltransferase family 61 protein [Achromobacter sp. B7]